MAKATQVVVTRSTTVRRVSIGRPKSSGSSRGSKAPPRCPSCGRFMGDKKK